MSHRFQAGQVIRSSKMLDNDRDTYHYLILKLENSLPLYEDTPDDNYTVWWIEQGRKMYINLTESPIFKEEVIYG